MEITTEYLEQRLAEFRQQYEDALKQLGAVGGAIQFCEFLLNELGSGKIQSPKNVEDAS